EVPGPRGDGATQPHWVGDPCVRAAGMAFLHHRDQRLRDQVGLGARSGPELSGPAMAHPPNRANSVTPKWFDFTARLASTRAPASNLEVRSPRSGKRSLSFAWSPPGVLASFHHFRLLLHLLGHKPPAYFA